MAPTGARGPAARRTEEIVISRGAEIERMNKLLREGRPPLSFSFSPLGLPLAACSTTGTTSWKGPTACCAASAA
ncbi:hypothetical protein [Streptomyces sp. NPDC005009]